MIARGDIAKRVKQAFSTFLPTAAGMVLTQIIATLYIFHFDTAYHHELDMLRDAGYLIIPNANVLPALLTYTAAVKGGLLFTLTIGIALSVITQTAASIWKTSAALQNTEASPGRTRLFRRLCLLSPWAVCLWVANHKGLTPFLTTLLIAVPIIVFYLTRPGTPLVQNDTGCSRPLKTHAIVPHLLLLIAFSGAIALQADISSFLTIRDKLLLGNPVGLYINRLYYDSSLYAANAFKSYSQQLMNPCRITGDPSEQLKQKIDFHLRQYDYLPVSDETAIQIHIDSDTIEFSVHNNRILRTAMDFFQKTPGKALRDFEHKSDRLAFFRTFTLFCLLFSSATVLYTVICLPVILILRSWLPPFFAWGTACGICIAIGWLLPAVFTYSALQTASIPQALRSDQLHHRLNALKTIAAEKQPGIQLAMILPATRSPHPAERYWAAKAIGHYTSNEARHTLMRLLDDTQFNVVCMAFRSLGMQGRRQDITPILKRLRSSENWYEQWYGYKALRRLGWIQKRSR